MLRDFWLLLGEDSAVWSVVGVSRARGVWRSLKVVVARAMGVRERVALSVAVREGPVGATRVALVRCGPM